MKVPCGQCPAKYAIADERIQGKKVRIRCKRCGAAIVVDGKTDPPTVTTTGGAVTVSADSAPPSSPRPEAKTMLGGLEAPSHHFDRSSTGTSAAPRPPLRTPRPSVGPSSGEGSTGVPAPGRGFTDPPEPGSGTAANWRVAVTANDLRWMKTAEIAEAYRSGVLKPETFVLRQGMSHWETLIEVPELAVAVGAPNLNGKASAAPDWGSARSEVDAPAAPTSSERSGGGPQRRMTQLGLGLATRSQYAASNGAVPTTPHAATPTAPSEGAPLRLDESFLTLPFTDAEAAPEPQPSFAAPNGASTPTPQPDSLPTFDPGPPPPSPTVPPRHAVPHASSVESVPPPFAHKPPPSSSLWPWLVGVVLVALAVAAAVVASQ